MSVQAEEEVSVAMRLIATVLMCEMTDPTEECVKPEDELLEYTSGDGGLFGGSWLRWHDVLPAVCSALGFANADAVEGRPVSATTTDRWPKAARDAALRVRRRALQYCIEDHDVAVVLPLSELQPQQQQHPWLHMPMADAPLTTDAVTLIAPLSSSHWRVTSKPFLAIVATGGELRTHAAIIRKSCSFFSGCVSLRPANNKVPLLLYLGTSKGLRIGTPVTRRRDQGDDESIDEGLEIPPTAAAAAAAVAASPHQSSCRAFFLNPQVCYGAFRIEVLRGHLKRQRDAKVWFQQRGIGHRHPLHSFITKPDECGCVSLDEWRVAKVVNGCCPPHLPGTRIVCDRASGTFRVVIPSAAELPPHLTGSHPEPNRVVAHEPNPHQPLPRHLSRIVPTPELTAAAPAVQVKDEHDSQLARHVGELKRRALEMLELASNLELMLHRR